MKSQKTLREYFYQYKNGGIEALKVISKLLSPLFEGGVDYFKF